jgi:hypothetical protein
MPFQNHLSFVRVDAVQLSPVVARKERSFTSRAQLHLGAEKTVLKN